MPKRPCKSANRQPHCLRLEDHARPSPARLFTMCGPAGCTRAEALRAPAANRQPHCLRFDDLQGARGPKLRVPPRCVTRPGRMMSLLMLAVFLFESGGQTNTTSLKIDSPRGVCVVCSPFLFFQTTAMHCNHPPGLIRVPQHASYCVFPLPSTRRRRSEIEYKNPHTSI